MSDLTVRAARPDEFERAAEVTIAAYLADGWLVGDDPYRDRLADTPGRAREAELLVAVDAGDRVVGTVTLCLPGTPWSEISRPGEVEFRMLAVDPAARGRGVGAALVTAVVQRARELGAHRVVLCSALRMATAQRIYQRMGFVRLPDRDWSPETGKPLMAYGLNLSGV
jgi:ribosomal protein S18 acetylase RimI-like enzyme